MWRVLAIGAVVAAAALAGDILFRASLLRTVRPVILAPTDGAAVSLPVRLHWEGPRRMRVIVWHAGRERWDLGVRESPAELPTKYFTRRGLYSVEIKSPRLGDWISSRRSFSIRTARVPPAAREQAGLSGQLAALQKSVLGLRLAQQEMRDENASPYEESAAIREEHAILTEALNRLAEGERRATNRAAARERQYAELQEAHRVLRQESQRLLARPAAATRCASALNKLKSNTMISTSGEYSGLVLVASMVFTPGMYVRVSSATRL